MENLPKELSEGFIKLVNKSVDALLKNIDMRQKLGTIGLNEMRALWEKGCSEIKNDNICEIKSEKEDKVVLLRSTNNELKAMCKARGLKCSGNKADLIQRLQGGGMPLCNSEARSATSELRSSGLCTSERSSSGEKKSKPKRSPESRKSTPGIQLRKNRHGNFEHPESGLVFDRADKLVIGKQSDDGSISELSPDDIKLCEKYNFEYRIALVEEEEDEGEIEEDVEEVIEDDSLTEEEEFTEYEEEEYEEEEDM